MNIEELRIYCLSKKGVSDSFPFNETALTFKVLNKMFLIAIIDSKPVNFSGKCNPEKAIEYRELYQSITPGYHLSKKHWNTIEMNEDISTEFAKELIDHSYDLVVAGLTKKQKLELE